MLTDWRITAQPPLTLRNDLPVAAYYVLWERPARGGSLVLRQQGRLEGWSSINVYSVDMRQQVRPWITSTTAQCCAQVELTVLICGWLEIQCKSYIAWLRQLVLTI
jgi:hypothetical protein